MPIILHHAGALPWLGSVCLWPFKPPFTNEVREMTDIQVNEHGVPQYPKGHTGRLLVTLAAIDKLERPTATSVAALTGLSKGKIDDYVQALNAELGMGIIKDGPEYRIMSWGELLKKTGVKKCLRVPLNGTNMGA